MYGRASFVEGGAICRQLQDWEREGVEGTFDPFGEPSCGPYVRLGEPTRPQSVYKISLSYL